MEKVRIGTRVGTLVVAVALAAGACSGDDDASDVTVAPETSSVETTTSEAATTTTEDPAAAVEQAFFDQWDAFVEILEDPDPSNPLIDHFFTGPARDKLLDTISEFVEDSQAVRRPDDPDDFKPRVIAVEIDSETSATLFECTIDGITIVDSNTGETVNGNVSNYEARNTFELSDGQWKLASSSDLSEGDPTCADL